MTPLLLYLAKMSACTGLFYLYYLLALRNRIFHQWNRFYLLLAVAASLLIPLVHWELKGPADAASGKTVHLLRAVSSAGEYLEEVAVVRQPLLSTNDWLMAGYAVVSLVLLVLFFRSLLRIRRIVRSHIVQLVQSIRFVATRVPGAPFSFLDYVFWHEDIDLHSETGRRIFQHELVHVEQRHSWDKIFLQLALIVFWCNPFLWLIRRELAQIHEFIADRKSVAHHGTEAFADMILQSAYPQHYHQLTQSFFQSSIKRRLRMITRNQNARLLYFSRILALPLLFFAVLAFTVKTHPAAAPHIPLQQAITVVIDAGHGTSNGQYTGAQAEGVHEDDIVLSLAKKIQELNTNKQVRIVLTRSNPESVGLEDRVAVAVKNKADLFISLHLNDLPKTVVATPGMHTDGIELYIPKDNVAYKGQSELLATALQGELKKGYKTYPYLMTHGTHVWVLDHNVCPSVLIECGYLSDAADRNFMQDEKNQEALAKNILAGIQQYARDRENPGTFTLADSASNEKPGIEALNDSFTKIIIAPSISKGDWDDFLQTNLQPLIDEVSKTAPEGQYVVQVRFVVNKLGELSDFSVPDDPGYRIGERLIGMMKKSPKWRPGMQNGQTVDTYYQQPIRFYIRKK